MPRPRSAISTAAPATAQQVVFDPRNHLENALQAARQLESLANEARSLAASPYSHLSGSSQSLRDMAELARTGIGLAHFSLDQPSLDEVFLALTGRGAEEPPGSAPTFEEQTS